jgi:hypothetical protein
MVCVQCSCPKQTEGVALSARQAAWKKGGTFAVPTERGPAESKGRLAKKSKSAPWIPKKLRLSILSTQYLGASVAFALMAFADYRSPLTGNGAAGRLFDLARTLLGPYGPQIVCLIVAAYSLMMALQNRVRQ